MKNFKKGFTLIGLMIVLIIICLLMSGAMVFLSTRKEKSIEKELRSEAERIRTTIMQQYWSNITEIDRFRK
jgi:prepilin-type N-terminal cleavage/methylation domain-containing protein